jgi:predicted AAA+ superfamily ATPase
LAGVRQSGKTTLARSLESDRVLYVNCDVPAVEDLVGDPVLFYRGCERPVVVFDEIHQLRDPSRLLKIGADEFPHLRILATGSSTLAAGDKFRDALTGRKRVVHLTPVLFGELADFGVGLQKRLFHGGLPGTLLQQEKRSGFYREWIDSFFARDVQRLFGFRDMNRFNALVEYLLRQSGGILDMTKTASALGVARATVQNHLEALQITQAITLVRPFHGVSAKEIVRMPRLYAFDTGFVSFARGWDPLRPDDYGVLWEHLVLEHLQAHLPDCPVHYWRDKAGREVDFVLPRRRDEVDAIECKWDPNELDPTGLKAFRALHPVGRNFVVSPITVPAHERRQAGLDITVCDPRGLNRRTEDGDRRPDDGGRRMDDGQVEGDASVVGGQAGAA